MLGQYMHSIGYGAYEPDTGYGFAFNGLGDLGMVSPNFLFEPVKIEEGEFKGAMLSRGFTLVRQGNNIVIRPKGQDILSGLVASSTGSQAAGLAVGLLSNLTGSLTGIGEIPLPDPKKPFSRQTDAGTVVYEPAGMNIILIAGVAVAVGIALMFMLKR